MKIAFLDRDGVINKYPGDGGYVTKVKDFHLIPGATEAIARLTKMGYAIFVVSNQAGISRGIYSKHKLDLITSKMLSQVEKKGGKIKKVLYCTHTSQENCDCRKPKIGSIKKALQYLNKTIHHAKKSYFVGDTDVDIQAGHNAGCTTILVLSGRDNRQTTKKWSIKPDYIAKNLLEASKIIESHNSNHS